MATSIPPIDALLAANAQIKGMPLEDLYLTIANSVHRRIWQLANWTWTLASTPAITVPASTTGGTQTVEFTSLTNVGRFIEAVGITPIATGGGRTDTTEHMRAVSLNPTTTLVGRPTTFQYIPAFTGSTDAFKFNVLPAYPVACTLTGVYKKVFPAITAANLGTASSNNPQLPDDWYHVYEDGVLWQAYQYAGDQRAGSTANGQYTGQLALFMAGLANMLAVEPTYILERRAVEESS